MFGENGESFQNTDEEIAPMGFRICYIASKIDPHEMARSFGLEVIQSAEEMPSGDWWIAKLISSGWTILWAEDETFGANSRELISELSKNSDIVHCEVDETAMWCSAEYWSGGNSIWKLEHASDRGDIFHLESEGSLPSDFDAVKEGHFGKQKEHDDVDYIFEIPLEVARLEIDFRHEDVLEPTDVESFLVVAPALVDAPALVGAPTKRKGFLARMLGR